MTTLSDEAAAGALARLYDLDLLDDPGDLDLYLALAGRTGGPILEVAVGTGRLAIRLAGAGYEVTGVDNDPAMLSRARSRAKAAGAATERRLLLIEADLRGLRLPDAGTFRLAFIALNSLLALGDRPSQQAAFRALADHLAPGGLAVVDVWLPDAEDLARFDGRLILEEPRVEPETGNLVLKTAAAVYDAATATVKLTTIYDEGEPGVSPVRWVKQDRLRLAGADELTSLAEQAGLELEMVAGGYDLEPLGPGSDRAVLIAVKP